MFNISPSFHQSIIDYANNITKLVNLLQEYEEVTPKSIIYKAHGQVFERDSWP